MTNDDLQALCTEWQKTLRLQDWDITATFARHYEMQEPYWLGQCSANDTMRSARIKILDPNDHHEKLADQDIEETLVHEQLHLYFPGSDDPARDLSLEQGINAVAKALVSLKRGS
jgi:hypothetical protein